MPTANEILAQLAQMKADNPHVDWDVYEPYALVNQVTGEVERMSWARKDKIMNLSDAPEVGR